MKLSAVRPLWLPIKGYSSLIAFVSLAAFAVGGTANFIHARNNPGADPYLPRASIADPAPSPSEQSISPDFCGKPPPVSGTPEAGKDIRFELRFKAIVLSGFIGTLTFHAKLEKERNELYNTADFSSARIKDAYLFYSMCTIVSANEKLSLSEKVEALSEFSRAPSAAYVGSK